MKIAIVMNDYQIRSIYCSALKKAGHETQGYANAESCLHVIAQAARRLEEQPHEIVITEAELKDGLLSGGDLLASITTIAPHVKIHAFSEETRLHPAKLLGEINGTHAPR